MPSRRSAKGARKQFDHPTYKALVRVGAIYDLERALKDLTLEERFKERQTSIKPLVEEFFAWIRETLADQKGLPRNGQGIKLLFEP